MQDNGGHIRSDEPPIEQLRHDNASFADNRPPVRSLLACPNRVTHCVIRAQLGVWRVSTSHPSRFVFGNSIRFARTAMITGKDV